MTGDLGTRIRFAIANRRLLELRYAGIARVAEPHDYGMLNRRERLLVCQLRGPARPGQASIGWRLLDISRIEGLTALDDTFSGSRGTGYLDQLEQSKGESVDLRRTVHWLRQAADAGAVNGQVCLGGVYALGVGVPQNYVEAHKWLNLAAARDEPGDLFDGDRDDIMELREKVAKKLTPRQLRHAQVLATQWLEAFDRKR